jgi:nitrous oxidase accessory protein NosD
MQLISILLALLPALTLAYPGGGDGGGGGHGDKEVSPGQSIQRAIDKANSYDTIIIKPGTYAEQLTITKSGITLLGQPGATLVPPAPGTAPVTNACTGEIGPGPEETYPATQAGICIAGSGIVRGNWLGDHYDITAVDKRIKDVKVKGLTIKGFPGLNINIVGGKDTVIAGNVLENGGRYGLLTVFSKGTTVKNNKVLTSTAGTLGDIAICMDDESPTDIFGNTISGYHIGFCVQTNGAEIHDNEVSNSCIGAFVDPGISDVQLKDNVIKDNWPLCATTYFAEWGIVLFGASNNKIKGNKISGITNPGNTDPNRVAAGIIVLDDQAGTPSSNNRIVENKIKNTGLDILLFTKGTGNVVKNNYCTTSAPEGLCSA